MKTAISIPDDIFKVAERLARHASDDVTDAMNRVCAEVDPQPDNFTAAASSRILRRAEW